MATKGLIGFYGLESWWETTFTMEEKKFIIEKYQPLGISGNILTEDNHSSNQVDFIWLAQISTWFHTLTVLNICEKFVLKAEELFDSTKVEIMDLHFYYYEMMQFFYKKRDVPKYYEKAKEYCKRQIEISEQVKKAWRDEYPRDKLPSHPGYKQLCIIYDKEKDYKSALALAKKAKKEGWTDDWVKRIEKLKSKLEKK